MRETTFSCDERLIFFISRLQAHRIPILRVVRDSSFVGLLLAAAQRGEAKRASPCSTGPSPLYTPALKHLVFEF